MRLPHLIHRWIVVKSTLRYSYEQCRACGKRRVYDYRTLGAYEPAPDAAWVETGQWSAMDAPPWRLKDES